MQNLIDSPVATLTNLAVERLEWARNFTQSILDTLTEDQLMHRAGGAGNHTIWVIGHIANTDDAILSVITGNERALPDSYEKLFGGGSTPVDDRNGYPTTHELRTAMQTSRERLVEWVQSLDETTIHQATPEPLRPLARDAITVPFTLAAHDLFHLGQVAAIRSTLGMDPVHA